MKHRVIKDLVVAMAAQTIAKEFLEDALVGQICCFAYLRQYPLGLLHVKTFWQTSTAPVASSATTVNKPANCQKILSIMVTGQDANSVAIVKQVTPVDVMQRVAVQGNAFQAGSVSNPKYQEDKLTVSIFPHLDGRGNPWQLTFHYLRNFGYITDDDFEVTDFNVNALPILPCWQLEDAVLDAVKEIKLRAAGFQDAPSAIEQMSKDIAATMLAIREAGTSDQIYALTLPGTAS